MKKIFVTLFLIVFTVSARSEIVITTLPSNSELFGVCALNNDTVFATGPGIWKSTNAGVNWFMVFGGGGVIDIHFANASIGYALMGNPNGFAFQAPVLKTTNGGLNWFSCFVPQDSLFFTRIYVKSSTEIFGIFPGAVIGHQAQLYRSTNGGINFTMIFETGDIAFQGMVFSPQGTCYLATSNCWNSDDLFNWVMKSAPLSYSYAAPKYNSNRLFFAGTRWENNNFYSTISYTEDQGNSWTNYLLPDSGQCQELDFNSTGTGYAVGLIRSSANNWFAQTTNNGTSWNTLYISPFMIMNNVSAEGNTAYIVGKNGTNAAIMRYRDNVLAINSNSNIPKKFELKQNYPNPFNPSTTINYALSKESFVNITVYDVSGREVRTLVDELKLAGNYSLHFDASNLTSGVYFYTITTEHFSETKKMMLIK